ncbi:MAG: hypothetical protein A2Y34_02325 [Spirochaetes bacterium GWC1_27_15]|nr:MAG: hypothetical protein A2Z98_09720 [Spirochaetes bacterium GWB1_27_13]OHD28350.1 MAG: hypothetical protein A2Y34_02325 [Spirochaetes bacterium GWC1_27_15]
MEVQRIYERLLGYQSILTEKFKLQEKMEELPKVLSSRVEVLNRLKKSYLNKYNQFKKLEENIFSHQRMMGELSLHQKRLEEKTKLVKGQREYESLFKEIDGVKQKEDEYRFQLLQDQRVIDDLKNALQKDEMSIKQQEEELSKEQERINVELSKIKHELDSLVKQEKNLVADVDDNLKYKFEKIVKNKDGIGIVSISKGHCNGCYLVLPPEFINQVRMDQEIYFCQNCSRILYYDPKTDNDLTTDYEDFSEDDDDFFDNSNDD